MDGLSQFFKFAVALGFAIAVLNGSAQPTLEPGQRADYFLLLSLSALGLMFLASAVELITIYLALELSSYSLYALIPMRHRDPRAAEAGIKYILFGAAATALVALRSGLHPGRPALELRGRADRSALELGRLAARGRRAHALHGRVLLQARALPLSLLGAGRLRRREQRDRRVRRDPAQAGGGRDPDPPGGHAEAGLAGHDRPGGPGRGLHDLRQPRRADPAGHQAHAGLLERRPRRLRHRRAGGRSPPRAWPRPGSTAWSTSS